MGHYALPCFTLAKERKKAPQAIAQDLAKKIKIKSPLERLEAAGPYLNFYLQQDLYSQAVIEQKTQAKKKNNKVITLDFSQPNVMKPFSVGHLRSTMIGNAIKHILTFEGYKVVGINHLGDWGTQFGKMMVAYEKWGKERDMLKNPVHYMVKLYVRFHEEAEKNPELIEEARAWFAKLEKGDKKAKTYWKQFRDLSLQQYQGIYTLLNVTFDSWNGEAFYEPQLKPTIDFFKKKAITEESDGALVVQMPDEKIAPCMLQKSDGSSTYATRDLAAALYRKKAYKFHKNVYVVDVRQSLHFQQVFTTLERANLSWAKDCIHIPFGLMKFEEGVMSTRKGKVVYLEDLLKQSIAGIAKIIKEKNPKLKNKAKVAEQVGVGAVVFWDLSHDRVKGLHFSFEKVLDFQGETGPYVQYTHARASSILRKASNRSKPSYGKLTHEKELALVRELSLMEHMIEQAALQYKPHILAKHLITICQRFNEFYQECPCTTVEDKGLGKARLNLVRKTKESIALGLKLLGITAPEEM